MKKCICAILFLLNTAQLTTIAQTLDENLKILQPLIGNIWTGKLNAPDGNAACPTTCEFKAKWAGKIINLLFPHLKLMTMPKVFSIGIQTRKNYCCNCA